MHNLFQENSVFCPFDGSIEVKEMAADLRGYLADESHPLCQLAARKLQDHLQQQTDWEHNFGFLTDTEGAVIGKMFGVLVVRTKEGQLGYLAAFSGKLAGGNHHPKFVPPVFDGLEEGGFLNAGMEELSQMSTAIKNLESPDPKQNIHEIQRLKLTRKNLSRTLQDQLFEQYHFLNKAGESKGLTAVFKNTAAGKPSAGAGECAAPKLLQYAFQHEMEPLGLAEFWWGLSPKSDYWKHGQFYPPCAEKCAPILAHMLS
jgi:tRNA pseudouridine32 synthase/23S rRNA pseudouridine746 synthase